MGILNAIQYVTNPQLSTDDQSNPYALQQRQRLIDALKQQAVNPQQIQNAGAVVPRQSWVTPLAQALSGYYAGKMQKSEDTAVQGLADKKSAASQALIQSLYGQPQGQQQPDQSQQGPQASQAPQTSVASMFNTPQQSQAPQQAMQQPMPQPQGQDPYAAAKQKIAMIAQGIQSGTIDPELGKQLLTQAQKDATPPDDTDAVRNFKFAKQNGYAGSFMDYKDDSQNGSNTQLIQSIDPKTNQPVYKMIDKSTGAIVNPNVAPVMPKGGGFQGANLTQEQTDALNDAIGNGHLSPYRVNSRNAAILANSIIANPNADLNLLASNVKAQDSYASGGSNNKILQSVNTAISHMDAIEKLSDAMDSGDIQKINQAKAYWKEQTGQAAPSNMDAAAQLVGNEVIKAVAASGNGSKEEREKAEAAFARYKSGEQIKGVTSTYRTLLGGQIETKRNDFVNNNKLGTDEDFNRRFLTTRTRAALGVDKKTDSTHPPAIQSLLDKYK